MLMKERLPQKQREIINEANKYNLISTTNNCQEKVFLKHGSTGHFKSAIVKNTAEKNMNKLIRKNCQLFHMTLSQNPI